MKKHSPQMKKNIFIIFVFVGLAYGVIVTNSSQNTLLISPALILNAKSVPTKALSNLLQYFNVSHDNTLQSIVTKTQAKWLRTPGKERWEMQEIDVQEKNKVLQMLSALGCTQEIKPAKTDYDYVFILGALASRMVLRVETALNIWKQGIKFKNLIFLTGQRPRDLKEETADKFLLKDNNVLPLKPNWTFDGTMPATEIDIFKLIFDQIELPQDFIENVKVIFVDAPMQTNKEGKLVRPTTVDTINQCNLMNLKPGTSLFISNNPFIGYQDSVIRTYFSKEFEIETVGQAASANEKIAVYLDTIARWLYQENERINLKK